MQTFLPYPSYVFSLVCLDSKRLGKQRVEAKQILKALDAFPADLLNPGEKLVSHGWRNHPAVRMWVGCEVGLVFYYNLSLDVWESRGYKNSMPRISLRKRFDLYPSWFGNDRFHAAHRSNLLRKDPEHYSQFGWKESPGLPYLWPLSAKHSK